MNRQRILKDLAMVERDLVRDAEAIHKQQQIIAELTATGRTALRSEASGLLAKFQALQRMDINRRDRLTRELDECDVWNDGIAQKE